MKKAYDLLGILTGSFIGVFLGRSGYTFWHYRTFPGLYAAQSAPWYASILVNGVCTAALAAAALLVRRVLRKKLRERAVS